ncbi:DUF2785 domain-containing protein [Lacticaseibacillus nasuensis]|uniref:DUF2785 domain-containing protein n=1 Tax=Lacticaseibacillus nasuensis TaxID=944671 RepID=UPI0006D01A3C|nr:DUF2785 domain-containing protein [Lacticaseibacillus nasuensis]
MANEVAQIQAQVADIQQRLLAGKLFRTLPAELGQLMANAPELPATPIEEPHDDLAALARIHAIGKRVKAAKNPTVTDVELEFMLAHLASTSPAVRDKGVFFLLNDLLQVGALSDDQLLMVFTRLQAPDILYAHILEPENDAVFLRSFAVMILSVLTYADSHQYHLFSEAEYHTLVLRLTAYIVMEKDGRGYVAKKGWAHTYVHIGNALDELTNVEFLQRGEKILLMAAAIEGWQRIDTPLVYGEDQRIALYLTNLAAKHEFYANSLVMCLTHWQQKVQKNAPRESIRFWNRWYNRDRLLSGLLMRGDLPQVVVDYLQKILDFY